MIRTNYLPLNPPQLGDDDEGCVMVLIGQHIWLYHYGLCWYLDEDEMAWHEIDPLRGLTKDDFRESA